MNNVVSHIADDLRDQVQYAAMTHDVYRCMTSRETRPKYVKDMNSYLGFFASTLHASFVCCVVTLYALYETRRDTINFHTLQRELDACDEVSVKVKTGFKKLVADAHPTWKKVSILRNEALGHLTDRRSMAKTFERAGLTPLELEKLIRLAKRTLNYLGKQTRGFGYPFPEGARADTIRMFQDLSSCRASANDA